MPEINPISIPMPPLRAIILHSIRHIYYRTRECGLWSGWICLKTHAINFYLRTRDRYSHEKNVECPCCGWRGYAFRSLDVGHLVIPHIECPNCRAHQRHRLFQLFAERRGLGFLAPGSRVLHCAPEWHVRQLLEALPDLWVTSSDLELYQIQKGIAPRMICDLCHVPVQSGTYDTVFLFHVLEHIRDDRGALAEIYRLLKPGGTVVIMVPVNPALDATEEWDTPRKDLYDHVRDYSASDFPDRLKAFDVERIDIHALAKPDEQWRYMIFDHEYIYLCRKPE